MYSFCSLSFPPNDFITRNKQQHYVYIVYTLLAACLLEQLLVSANARLSLSIIVSSQPNLHPSGIVYLCQQQHIQIDL